MFKLSKIFSKEGHNPKHGGLEILKYIGPGLLVTAGFIDPGNWAVNIEAGSSFGYSLLWVVTFSTVILIVVQHNAAHLGIATGYCLSEATSIYIKPKFSKIILITAELASVSTAVAAILGCAIGIQMLSGMPLWLGALVSSVLIFVLLFTNSYKRIESWIIAFVSIIGISFIYELSIVDVKWTETIMGSIKPEFPHNSLLIIASILGAVIMPHNLYLHSEIIQSRQWNKESKKIIHRQLNYEFFDTLISMIVGWAINCAIIILAASVFFENNIVVNELQQAKAVLEPLLGKNASVVFAVALAFAGFASGITAGIAGGSIFSGFFKEPYDIKDNHTRFGVGITLVVALILIFLINNPFNALIYSQTFLCIQLPVSIFSLIYMTSSKRVMGDYVNKKRITVVILLIAILVTALNFGLLLNVF
ncbi:MAG: Nramp family divalent metal transporter [Bacteroidales bacterium]|nr:Nramp family divalent metal transporter [Bacteroidales bacterium]